MISFKFVDGRQRGLITDWNLDHRQRKAVQRKLRLLEKVDRRAAEGSILYSLGGGIWEVEIRGNVQLRPRACFGPEDPDSEVTFLAQAQERDNKTIPSNVNDIAAANLLLVQKEPTERRRQIWPQNETS